MCMLCSVTQLCLTLCDPHGPHGPHQAPVHGILQAIFADACSKPTATKAVLVEGK